MHSAQRNDVAIALFIQTMILFKHSIIAHLKGVGETDQMFGRRERLERASFQEIHGKVEIHQSSLHSFFGNVFDEHHENRGRESRHSFQRPKPHQLQQEEESRRNHRRNSGRMVIR